MEKTKTGADAGALSFPNASRAYDERRPGVQFWGYDRTIEVTFFIEVGALAELSPGSVPDEVGCLGAFDGNLDRIRTVAAGSYARRRKASYITSYVLTAADF